MGDTQSEASSADKLLLWLWTLACFIATLGLFIYLRLSIFPGLEALSENPSLITLIMGVALATCVAILLLSERRPAFDAELKQVLLAGTISAILGVTAYGTYVYAFSQTLASAEAAPKVGDAAPDFKVTDPEGYSHALSDNLGAPILMVFYRGHW